MKSFLEIEINEQSKVLENIVNNINVDNYVNKLKQQKVNNIIILGCGSSYFAGSIGKYFLDTYTNLRTEVIAASEFSYFKEKIQPNTLVIFISQSGETKDLLVAHQKIENKEILTLGIVNVDNSTLSKKVDDILFTNTGAEKSIASTKSFTGQISILYKLAISFAGKEEKVDNVKLINNLELVAEKIYKEKNMFLLGRGIDSLIVKEGALKIKEITNIHAEGYAMGEFKHGSISLLEKHVPVIILLTEEKVKDQVINNIKEIKEKGAFVLLIKSDEIEVCSKLVDEIIEISSKNKLSQTIEVLSKLQFLALNIGLLNKLDVDNPRFLVKSISSE